MNRSFVRGGIPSGARRQHPRVKRWLVLWFAFSGGLAYWIVHSKPAPAPPVVGLSKDHERLQENNLFFCPVCGESVRLEPSPLSIGIPGEYRRHPHELRRIYDDSRTPEFDRDE